MLRAVKRYLAGEVPLRQVFFHDMLLIGTMVNVATGLATLAAFALELPAWAGIAVFLSPQPYNLVLAISVWRSATHTAVRWGETAKVVAILWWVLMLVV